MSAGRLVGQEEFQHIYYELDGEEVGTALRADEYGGDEDFSG